MVRVRHDDDWAAVVATPAWRVRRPRRELSRDHSSPRRPGHAPEAGSGWCSPTATRSCWCCGPSAAATTTPPLSSPTLESVTFRPASRRRDRGDLGDAASGQLLRTALRVGFRSSAGPFRSLARLAVEPRAYQYVPLLMALRQDPVRVLIADDVGIGKTIEAGLIAAELIAQGDVGRLAVLCSPALAEQWQRELRDKFGIDAEVVLPSTAGRLSRGLMLDESLFDRHPYTVISTDFIKSPQRRQEFLNHCPELVIVDEAHTCVADGASEAGDARPAPSATT